MNIIVLISGNGSNLQAIIDSIKNGLNVKIQAVISNKEDSYGILRAEKNGITTYVVPSKKFNDRSSFEYSLLSIIEKYSFDLIILAGFMKCLSPEFVKTYKSKIINIHPSLLPKYPGLHTHRRVLENNEKEHGSTVHFVTEELDGGPIIAQEKIKISDCDNEESVREKVQALEHRLYPRVLQKLSDEMHHKR